MKRRTFLTATGAAIVGLQFPIRRGLADEKVIRFAMPQDFTRVYTFVTVEYSQASATTFRWSMPKAASTATRSSPTSPITAMTFRARWKPMSAPRRAARS